MDKTAEPLTLQEAKDQVAKNNGWDNWNHIHYSESLSQEAKDILFSMAAEQHASNKCEAAESLLKEVINYDYNHLRKHNVSALTAELSEKIKEFLNHF